MIEFILWWRRLIIKRKFVKKNAALEMLRQLHEREYDSTRKARLVDKMSLIAGDIAILKMSLGIEGKE